MSGEAGEELDTPAARIMARRESRAAMPDRLKVAAPDDSSDEEWNGDDDEDEEEDGRVYLDASKCGRVRLHAVQGAAQSSKRKEKEKERKETPQGREKLPLLRSWDGARGRDVRTWVRVATRARLNDLD